MAEKSVDLPEECWELIIKLLDRPCHFSVSLVCRKFLSITNRLCLSLKVSDPKVQAILPRLLQRFRHLKQIDLTGFQGNQNSILYQISQSGLNLESLTVSDQATLPVAGLRALGPKMRNLKGLNCSKTRGLRNHDLNVIADSFPWLEEVDISDPGLSNSTGISKPISDSGILALSSKLKNLRKINLSGNIFITDKSLVFLSINCLLLSQVVIHFCDFITLNGISKLIRDCGRLICISVRGIGIPMDAVELINWKGLWDIDLSDCFISDKFLYAVAEARFPMKKLRLSGCASYSFAGISFLLNVYRSLEYLDLEGANFLMDTHIAELSRFLHSIRYINLSYCRRLTKISFYTLTRNCPMLDEIEMAWTGIEVGDESIETGFEANFGIKSLNLAANCLMRNDCLISVASICPNLEQINLSNCRGITEEGLVELLKRCSQIKQLEVYGSSVVKKLLVNLEFDLPKLKVLSLSFSEIDDVALAMIGKRCCRLVELELDGCFGWTSKGVKEVVENCKQLREINLCWCNLSADIVPWMVFARPSLKKIVAPCGFVPTESQRNLFLRHGCLVSESKPDRNTRGRF